MALRSYRTPPRVASIRYFVGKFLSMGQRDAALKDLRDELPEIVRSQGGVMFLEDKVEALLVARWFSFGGLTEPPR